MFSLQEYQHVHLLWFKKRSFTLVWKPNYLRTRADAASESTMGARCSRSAYAPLLRCLCVRCETGVNQALLKRLLWKRLSSRDQWNLSPATMCCGWQRSRFGAAQTMHSHKCDHAKFLLAHSQKMLANIYMNWCVGKIQGFVKVTFHVTKNYSYVCIQQPMRISVGLVQLSFRKSNLLYSHMLSDWPGSYTFLVVKRSVRVFSSV